LTTKIGKIPGSFCRNGSPDRPAITGFESQNSLVRKNNKENGLRPLLPV
jgi:hypothetical protein